REEKLSDRLGELLKGISVPEGIADRIVEAMQGESTTAESDRQQRIADARQRLAALRTRMDQMYEDKLDGKIDEQFWTRKMSDCREQERTLEAQLSALSTVVKTDNVLTVQRVFELANRAYSLYLTRNSAERGQLLKSVL